MLNSGHFITILHKISGKLSTAPGKHQPRIRPCIYVVKGFIFFCFCLTGVYGWRPSRWATFVEAGYKCETDIAELTDENLITIGITLIGHRNNIMKGINSLRDKDKKQAVYENMKTTPEISTCFRSKCSVECMINICINDALPYCKFTWGHIIRATRKCRLFYNRHM